MFIVTLYVVSFHQISVAFVMYLHVSEEQSNKRNKTKWRKTDILKDVCEWNRKKTKKKIPSHHNNISWKDVCDLLFKHEKGVKTWLSSLIRKTANVHLVDDFSLFEFSCFFFSFLLFTKRCIRMKSTSSKSIWIFCVFVFILSNISKWEMW